MAVVFVGVVKIYSLFLLVKVVTFAKTAIMVVKYTQIKRFS